MTQKIHWSAIALRLLLTIVAGTALGLERSKTGHPAGLRTTLCLSRRVYCDDPGELVDQHQWQAGELLRGHVPYAAIPWHSDWVSAKGWGLRPAPLRRG
jgi:hypothetical protein